MTLPGGRLRLHLLVCLALAALLPAPLPAQDAPVADDRGAIETLLAGRLAAGFAEKSIDKFLSAYAPEVRVVHYIYGEIDRATLGQKTLEDFAALDQTAALITVLEAQIDGPGALLTINFGTSGVSRGGKPVNRQERYYLRLRKDSAGWLIVEQAYRPDFKSPTRRMHGAPR